MLTIIVPVFNEEPAIPGFHEQMTDAMGKSGIAYELLYVNDGSTDCTEQLLSTLGAKVVHLERNMGYGAAIKVGIKNSTSETLAIIDCDGTYDPYDLIKLHRLMDKSDMVVGQRPPQKGLRSLSKSFLNAIASYAVSYRIPDLNCGLRVFTRELVSGLFKMLPNGFSFTSTLTMGALYNPSRVRFIPIKYSKRTGKSKIKPLSAFLGFLMLISRTTILFNPLKFFIPSSLFFGFLGFIFLVRDLLADDVAQASVLMITNGFILLAIGLLAEAIRCRD
jgi:glycosyltransferase involved in cell wall biosynthesis